MKDQERAAIHRLMESETNRLVMHSFLEKTRVFGGMVWPTEAEGRTEQMAFNMGAYEFGRWMLESIKHASPVGYQNMMREAYTRELEQEIKNG